MKVVEVTAGTLAGVRLLRGLRDQKKRAVAQYCRGGRYPAGAEILSHQDESGSVYFVISGRVRVTFTAVSAKVVTFRDLAAGDLFGDLAAIDGQRRSATVVTLEESLLAWMSARDFREVLTTYPEVTMAALRQLTGLVRNLSDRIVEFSSLGVNNRIHAELLRLARGHTAARLEDLEVVTIAELPTHQEIANRISTHREAVSRELARLEKLGLIGRDGHGLRIRDVPRLARMVAEVKGEVP